MKKDRVRPVVALLESLGFHAAGHTASESVRIPTTSSPVFGGAGGEVRDLGGRPRFRCGEIFVTVGPLTTCVYTRRHGHSPFESAISDFRNFRSSDLGSIERELSSRLGTMKDVSA